ncbi:uncharacterized protein CMC5_011180 [Chondromyces crocatus]|uniref:Permease n=2 Tax=Chondromyces crocatus TaxID=52 RepID=A0A0K1E8H8_CHOCO|nr:uncharacterized protein CMC5_011180 [Chondromyces crocatus]
MDRERWLAVIFRTGLVVFFIWMTEGILIPIVLGALFALLLSRLLPHVERRLGRAKGFAPLAVTVSSLVLIVIPFVFISVEVVRSVSEFLTRDWTATFNRLQTFVTSGIDIWGHRVHIGGPQIQSVLSDVGQRTATFLAGLIAGLATSVPNFIVNLFLFLVALYYFLRDGDELQRWMLRVSPFSGPQTGELFASVRETVNGAILGLIATALVQGGLTLAALYIFSVPNAFLLGVAATLMSFLPIIGTTPVTVGSAIYLFVVGRYGAGVGMMVAAAIVGLSDNIVRPWAQSSQGSMHPLLALLGIFGGIELFGAAGIFIGPIVAAMAVWAVDTYVRMYPRHDPVKNPAARPPAPVDAPPPVGGVVPVSPPAPSSVPPSGSAPPPPDSTPPR